ncbi:hypothetical protein Pst134EB_001520 [Puccinia striiformis f. sp. tritici]|nr:hypothetical protein Pst134EB_001520 [Puccinia striiformis f. sp. tritici]
MSNEQQNEEIRNILSQLQRQARDVTRELARCRGELGSKVRVGRQSALTLTELNKLSTGDINFYQPVGKMYTIPLVPLPDQQSWLIVTFIYIYIQVHA